MPDIPERPSVRKPIKPPTNFSVEILNDGAYLEWSSVSEAESYQIFRSNEKDGEGNLIVEVNDSSYTDKEIQYGGTFFYRIKSKKDDVCSIFSERKQISYFLQNPRIEQPQKPEDPFGDIEVDSEDGNPNDTEPYPPIPDTPPDDFPIPEPPMPEPPLEEERYMEPVEIEYDQDSSYFFTFGVRGAGKSVMISTIIYNILAHRIGDRLVNTNDDSKDYQLRGTKLFNDMVEGVQAGKWVKSTSTLRSENQIIPRQINLKYQPKKKKSQELKFALMDFSGEDLEELRPEYEDRRARLAPGIEAFLNLPNKNLIFICVYPAVLAGGMEREIHTSYILNFFNEIDRLKKSEVPIIVAVTKWDLVQDQYESAAQFMAENDPMIWSKLNDSQRKATIREFSVGEVLETGRFNFDPKYANKLFEWMYYSRTGDELGEPAKKQWWKFNL